MTSEEQFQDLKQFISAEISQSESRLRNDLVSKGEVTALRAEMATKEDLAAMEERIIVGTNQQTEIIVAQIDELRGELKANTGKHDACLDDYDVRIARLEHAV